MLLPQGSEDGEYALLRGRRGEVGSLLLGKLLPQLVQLLFEPLEHASPLLGGGLGLHKAAGELGALAHIVRTQPAQLGQWQGIPLAPGLPRTGGAREQGSCS